MIEEVHKILDKPAPTQEEIDALVDNAVNNMVRVEGGEFKLTITT